ncbi:hypothetical protein GGQ22_04350 [Nocardioides sp. zg-579]|uniref:SRPBCC family protein n=1 Tax=Nocardioides marmotae TaxID=2663857 RepID=A0A6I3J7W2_9ACTN|nr:hypothetical protein [Nocardioides marmotae]MCR6030673.1 hypothetical protein [Gordonia jinghuaiqii]MTB94309.1 hypothetical protein [Nocardioides marmotae]QKE00582.1 hypothetical protein HPC71_05425 [Nocardioides marmotae]
MEVVGTRARRLPAPPHVVWRSLAAPDEPGTRPWLAPALLPDEVVPQVLESDEPRLVVWSSLWPRRPDDRIELETNADRGETPLRFVHLTPLELPPEETLRHLRRRVNQLLFAELRFSYGG